MKRLTGLSLFLVSLLVLGACGGGDDEATPTGSLTAEDVAPDLVAALGVPATLHSPPVTETFGPDGGELELADGAVLEVPDGAFVAETEVTAAIINLEMGDEVEATRAYHITLEGGLESLAEPLILRAAEIGSNANALLFRDGALHYLDFAADGRITFTIGADVDAQVQSPGSLRSRKDEMSAAPVVAICPSLLYEVGTATFYAALAICMEFFPGERVLEDSCAAAALAADLDPVICEDPEWAAHVIEETRIDLERADLAESDIETMLSELEDCLLAQLSSGATQEAALDECDMPLESPSPTATASAQETAVVTQPPTSGPTAAPTVAPTAQPTAAPQEPTVSFSAGPTGVVVREYDSTEDLCAGPTCRDYSVSGSVSWSGLSGGAFLQCYGSGRSDEGFRVAIDPPSGLMAFDLTVSRWQFDGHPNIHCELLGPDDSLLDFTVAPVQVP